MSADRCPSCAAALPPAAEWCNQCFADLRPAPAPAPAAPLVAEQLDGLTATPVATLAEVPAQPTGELPEALPGVVPTVDPTPATWPCLRCQTHVPFDDDVCPNCNAKFLDSALPGAEKTLLDKLPRGQRKASTAWLVMLFGGLTLTGVFVGLFTLLAVIF